jgi:PII-like signaling protein
MKLEGEGVLVRIFVSESDRFKGVPLYEALVQRAREIGLAGATVYRAFEGFGAHNLVHSARILRLSEDLPMVIEIVDRQDKIDAFLPELDRMVPEGMVTLEKVQVILYRARDEAGTSTH